jgi:hypothetical protein
MTQPRTAITAIRSPCRSKEPGRRWEHDTAIEHNELPMPVNMNSLARKDGHRRTELGQQEAAPGCHEEAARVGPRSAPRRARAASARAAGVSSTERVERGLEPGAGGGGLETGGRGSGSGARRDQLAGGRAGAGGRGNGDSGGEQDAQSPPATAPHCSEIRDFALRNPDCHGVTETDDKGTRASRPKM